MHYFQKLKDISGYSTLSGGSLMADVLPLGRTPSICYSFDNLGSLVVVGGSMLGIDGVIRVWIS